MALIVWETVALMFYDAGDRWNMVVDLQVYNSKRIKKICRCKKQYYITRTEGKSHGCHDTSFYLSKIEPQIKAIMKYESNFYIHSGYCLLI